MTFPFLSGAKKSKAFHDASIYPLITKEMFLPPKQELHSLLLGHYDIGLIDPYANNYEENIKTIYTYISNRLKTQHFIVKKLKNIEESKQSEHPTFLKNQKILGYTNCKVLVLLCYKKEIKDFLLEFYKCSRQEVSEMMLNKLDEKYDNEEEGLQTDFQVGLRFNGKSFVVKKKISSADIIMTSVDQILANEGTLNFYFFC